MDKHLIRRRSWTLSRWIQAPSDSLNLLAWIGTNFNFKRRSFFLFFILCIFYYFLDAQTHWHRRNECNEKFTVGNSSCTGEMVALFDRWSDNAGRMWGCYNVRATYWESTYGMHIYDNASRVNYCKTLAHEQLIQIN